jgi:homoserine dehydrogenase
MPKRASRTSDAAPINIGFLGFGTVGAGAFQTLCDNLPSITLKVGRPLAVKSVAVRNWNQPRYANAPLCTAQRAKDAWAVVEDPEIDIVVECMGGVEPAAELVLQALRNHKNVVTANKELIARRGREILEEADKQGVDIQFEAAVAGGIPIIRALKESLAGNRIQRMIGIVNGTTNYILTQMTERGCEFTTALAEAQAKGYAEKDPTADVEGHDAAYKLSILASIAFESRVDVEQVHREGIAGLTLADIEYARQLGYVVKLLAIGEETPAGLLLRVHPTYLHHSHPLTSVSGAFNAIWVQGSSVGKVMFYGQGAGSLPTGSAVVGDIIDIARNIRHKATGRLPCTCFSNKTILDVNETVTKFYLRMEVADRPGVLGRIATILGNEGVSVASVLQSNASGEEAEIVWVTHEVQEVKLRRALEQVQALDAVKCIRTCLRVED